MEYPSEDSKIKPQTPSDDEEGFENVSPLPHFAEGYVNITTSHKRVRKEPDPEALLPQTQEPMELENVVSFKLCQGKIQ